MREILFRGKPVNKVYGNGFIYGSLGVIREGLVAIYNCLEFTEDIRHFVIPETVGQYTGLTDKNGIKIFEGDIVVVNIKGYNTICKVAWADNVAQFQLWQTNTISHTPTALNLGNYDCEVIGNIHDNPELLKELGK